MARPAVTAASPRVERGNAFRWEPQFHREAASDEADQSAQAAAGAGYVVEWQLLPVAPDAAGPAPARRSSHPRTA